jgi:hypothetical protein
MVEPLREVVLPLFLVLGVVLRILGAAGFGAVVGAVLKNVLGREETTKYLIPVVFVAASFLFVAMGISRGGSFSGLDISAPGSPGTLGAFGLGIALSFFLLGRRNEEEE